MTNVALAGSDLSVNKTKMQTLNLMKTMMKSRAQDGADRMLSAELTFAFAM